MAEVVNAAQVLESSLADPDTQLWLLQLPHPKLLNLRTLAGGAGVTLHLNGNASFASRPTTGGAARPETAAASSGVHEEIGRLQCPTGPPGRNAASASGASFCLYSDPLPASTLLAVLPREGANTKPLIRKVDRGVMVALAPSWPFASPPGPATTTAPIFGGAAIKSKPKDKLPSTPSAAAVTAPAASAEAPAAAAAAAEQKSPSPAVTPKQYQPTTANQPTAAAAGTVTMAGANVFSAKKKLKKKKTQVSADGTGAAAASFADAQPRVTEGRAVGEAGENGGGQGLGGSGKATEQQVEKISQEPPQKKTKKAKATEVEPLHGTKRVLNAPGDGTHAPLSTPPPEEVETVSKKKMKKKKVGNSVEGHGSKARHGVGSLVDATQGERDVKREEHLEGGKVKKQKRLPTG